jgi:tyrosinase
VTANTELKPFYDASGKFWDSTGVKGTTPFGHTYPETQRWNYPSDQVYQTAVRNEVTRQYGANVINNFFANVASQPTAASSAVAGAAAPVSAAAATASAPGKSHFNAAFAKKAVTHPFETAKEVLGKKPAEEPTPKAAPPPVAAPPAAQAQQPLHEHPVSTTPAPGPVSLNVPKQFEHLIPDRTYVEWITNLRAVKHGLSQTFRVYVFLGDFNPDPASWPTEFNVVGRFTVLGRGGTTQCEKCQQDQAEELVVTGTVPLTSALLQDITVEHADLRSLNPEDVEPYLVKNLHWRVTVFDGSEKPREEVPGLKVSVVSTKVRIGDDGVPVYSGEYTEHPNITDGRPAGFGSGDDI